MLWQDLHRLVLPYAPNVPAMVLDSALLRSARELCSRAGVWREILTVTITAGNSVATLPTVVNGYPENAISARIGNFLLSPMTVCQSFSKSVTTGQPAGFLLEKGGELSVWPTPSADTDITTLVTVVPSTAATGIPDGVGNAFAEVISHGAASILLSQQGTPWFNPDASSFHRQEFERLLARAAQDERVGAGSPSIQVRPNIL